MYSELLRVPVTWHGVPVFGVGIALAVWLAVAALAMASTARQADWGVAARVHLPTVLLVAALLVVGVPRFLPAGVPIRSYGVLMLLGIIGGVGLTIHRAVQAGLAADDILSLALWVVPGGAIGGRLFYVIQYWGERIREPDFWGTLRNVLAFTEGGLVVYGAFLGAMAGFALYVRRNKLPPLAMADLVAPGMMVGLSLGRIGCLLNGCCYGGESDIPWAVTFPRENQPRSMSAPYAEQASLGRFYGLRIGASAADPARVVIAAVDPASAAERAGLRAGDEVTAINGAPLRDEAAAHRALLSAVVEGRSVTLSTGAGERRLPALTPPQRSLPVHPTQIYSAIDAGLLAWVLWSFYPYRRHDGEVMALMLLVHPVSRFMLEAIRVDESAVWGTGLSISQNLSIGLFAVGLALWAAAQRRPELAFPRPLAAAG
ncbi:MAG TPA: prolipoprotein diacylglyceryl transferase family protein [Lacipirellulaceae bacterium]|nr:prolipoprotein diacylglyceryl transferase family protein [Lacipirellulaceae bacterium]